MSVRAVSPAERDDALRAEPLGGEHPAQADGAVTDDRDGAARRDARADGGVVAGAQDVGERQQGGEQAVVGCGGGRELDQGAVGVGDADGLALAAVRLRAVRADRAPEAALGAGGGEALGAVGAGAVGPDERGDGQIADGEAVHPGADLLDDAEELVADALTGPPGRLAPVGPQVAAADAGPQDPEHHVGGLLDPRVRHLLHPDVMGGVDNGGAHTFGVLAGLRCWYPVHGTPRFARPGPR